jgi:triacylglycerol lipase
MKYIQRIFKAIVALTYLAGSPAMAGECVIFLHGMARTASSMDFAAQVFESRGYAVANIDYPSREHPIEELASMAVEAGLAQCGDEAAIHFVTHSLGGILVRYYLETKSIPRLGRVVMLAPPNKGSQVVDDYRNIPGFELLNGPAGMQLGTDSHSIPAQLGPVEYEVGVIAGTTTFNPILSQSLPNPDDGKVSVENTKVEGMSDFVAVPFSHPFIMDAPTVIDYAHAFISTGKFSGIIPP